jgi:hypothetical protein
LPRSTTTPITSSENSDATAVRADCGRRFSTGFQNMPAQMELLPITSSSALIGATVKLDRAIDARKPCCENLAIGRGPHIAELLCETCGGHRGWLSKTTVGFLLQTIDGFGLSSAPIVVRDSSLL